VTALDCTWTLDLAPELALGVLTGPERSETLEHLSTCAPCRTTVAGYTEVVDALTLVAPEVEPPAGFEERVLRKLGPGEDQPWWRRREGRRRAFALLVAATAAAILSIATLQIVNAARDPNRDVIATGRAPTVRAAALMSGTGLSEGRFYATLGTPSVAFVVVQSKLPDGNYDVEIVRSSGAPERVGSVPLVNGAGSWAGPVDAGLGNGAVLRIVNPDGDEVARGQLT
jgi:hypothetical protein